MERKSERGKVKAEPKTKGNGKVKAAGKQILFLRQKNISTEGFSAMR